MKHKLSLDKSNRVEIGYNKLCPKINDLIKLDSLACSIHTPALIVAPQFVQQLNLIRFQRNSQYKLLIPIDIDGKLFGINKIHNIRDIMNVDGYEIGFTFNKNENELFNEMAAINQMFTSSGARYFIRWVINANKGVDHLDKCHKALSKAIKSNINFEMITIEYDSDDSKVLHELVKSTRKAINMAKAKVKIKSKFSDEIIKHSNNVLYEFEAENLV